MKVAIVYKGRYQVRQALDLEVLAAVLREGGHPVSLVYDPDVFGVTDNVLQVPWLSRHLADPSGTARRIAGSTPDVVFFSVLPATYRWCRDAAERLKTKVNTPVVFTGLHSSMVPERVMRDPFVDFVIRGELEGAVNPFLEALSTANDPARLEKLWNPTGPVDLDALPLPDKDLFLPYVRHSYSYVAMVSRGCPNRCSFCEESCAGSLYESGYFRRKKVETVMAELREGKRRYGFREVVFKDSYLSGDTEWLSALMHRFREEIGVPFKCFCTVSGFDSETARLLKEGGCYCVEFGLQTWDDEVRHAVQRREETVQDAHRAFDICAEHELRYDVDHILGLPGETMEHHRGGALAYRDLRYLNRVKVHNLVYLPGADIVNHAQEQGVLPADMEERLADGLPADFYGAQDAGVPRTLSCFTKLYKILPLMPRWVMRWLLRGNRIRVLRLLPPPVVFVLQTLIALKNRDLRFVAYLRSYPRKVFTALFRSRGRTLLPLLGLALSGALAGLLVAEGVLRIWGPEYYRFSNRSNRYYSNPRGYYDAIGRNGQNTVYGLNYRTSARGLRLPGRPDDEFAAEWFEPCDIVVLGDSFTFGQGVRYQDTYVSRLASLLSDDGEPIRIRNYGMPAADIEEIRGLYLMASERDRCGLVIYGFVLNDFGLPDAYEIVGLDFIDQNNGGYAFSTLRAASATANFVGHSIDTIRLHRTTERAYLDAFDDDHATDKWELLRKLHEDIRTDGAQLMIVLFPLLYDFDDYPFDEPHRKIATFCEQEGIPFLDLLEAFSSQAAEDLWCHPTDHHPNEIAHEIAAEEIHRFLHKRLEDGALDDWEDAEESLTRSVH